MAVFKTKDGKEICAADYCKSIKNPPRRWVLQAEREEAETKAAEAPKKKEVADANNRIK